MIQISQIKKQPQEKQVFTHKCQQAETQKTWTKKRKEISSYKNVSVKLNHCDQTWSMKMLFQYSITLGVNERV